MFGPVIQEMSSKDCSSSGGHYVQRSITICAIFVDGITGNIRVKLF